jgi:hypothetical protein
MAFDGFSLFNEARGQRLYHSMPIARKNLFGQLQFAALT